uniref:Uncharacterized protein n=1 Tax=Nelumbo nucifera TaxID=4432 RepID=A0A822ZRB5_NELNU|nr:TPA_asm: hypothetical protein HUJ06_018431 [Nelumbo nucifera]
MDSGALNCTKYFAFSFDASSRKIGTAFGRKMEMVNLHGEMANDLRPIYREVKEKRVTGKIVSTTGEEEEEDERRRGIYQKKK